MAKAKSKEAKKPRAKKATKKLKPRSKPNASKKATSKKNLAKGKSKAKAPAAKLSRKKTLEQTKNLKPGKTKSGKKAGKAGFFARNEAGKLRFFADRKSAIAFAKNQPIAKAKGKGKGKGGKSPTALAQYNATIKKTMREYSLTRKEAQAYYKRAYKSGSSANKKPASPMLALPAPASKFKKVASKKAAKTKKADKAGRRFNMKQAGILSKLQKINKTNRAAV